MEVLLAELQALSLPHEPIAHHAAMTVEEQVRSCTVPAIIVTLLLNNFNLTTSLAAHHHYYYFIFAGRSPHRTLRISNQKPFPKGIDTRLCSSLLFGSPTSFL